MPHRDRALDEQRTPGRSAAHAFEPRLWQPVIAYLLDVKSSSQLGGGKSGFQLAFVFAENPYFTDKVLTKTYLMDPEDEDECLERAVGCEINWNPNPNPNLNPHPNLTPTLTLGLP